MTNTERYFIDLLGSFLNRSSLPCAPANIDWNELRRLGKIHAVAGIIGQMIAGDTLVPAEVAAYFKKKAFSTVMVSSAHIALGERVLAALNEAGIICAPFKGSVIRKYYPVAELRTFSDIDILVPEESFETAHNVMIDMGFTHTDGNLCVRGYRKDGFCFEIHTTMAGDIEGLNANELKYFTLAADRIENGEWQSEYHFVYCLWHLTKHLSGSGAGVRMFMDIAALMQQPDQYNWKTVSQYLEMLGITLSAKSILFMCGRWFGTVIPECMTCEIDDTTAEAMESYVITAGTFGFSARTTGSSRLRNQIAADTDEKKAKRAIICKMFFPDAAYMSKQYTWYSGSKLLLPFMWLYRLVHLLFSRRGASLKALDDVRTGGEKEMAEAQLLRRAGWDIYSKK